MTENPAWLSELIPADGNKFFVPYPPMPAVLLTPITFLLGNLFKQQYLAHILGAGIAILSMRLALVLKKGKKAAIFMGLLAGAGSIVWHLASVGSSWYLGQVTAAFFLTAAFVESVDKKRPIVAGAFLGAAYLSRVHTLLSLPLFLYLFKDTLKKDGYIKLALGLLPFILFNAFYNLQRFGVPWDKGYYLIPGVLDEPWYEKGIFDTSYIPRHLKAAFWSFPAFQKKPPYLVPSLKSLSIWITTPAFVFTLWAPIKKTVVKLTWITILLISIPIFTHGTIGFTQFGYRFAVDFYPFLFFLLILGIRKDTIKLFHYVALLIGIAVNAWGVVFLNKLGIFTF